MAPHVNKWSPLDGARKLQVTVTVIVITSKLSQFTYPYIMIVQPGSSSSRVNSSRELYCCWLLSCQLMPRIAIFRLCLPQQFKAMQSTATDDLACRDSLNALLNTKTPWGYSLHKSCDKSHTAAWLEAFLISNVGNLLSPDEFHILQFPSKPAPKSLKAQEMLLR